MKDKTTIQKLFSFTESQHLQKIKKINFEETFLQEETYQIQRKHWLNENGIWNVSWLCAWFQTDVCQIFHILMHVRLVTNITALCSVPLIPRHISSSTNSGFRGSKWKVILFVRVLISCCLQNQTCYDCTVSSMELFIVNELSEYAITKTHWLR